MEDARPLTSLIRPAENRAEWVANSPSHNIIKKPHAKPRTRYTPNGGRDHVCNGGGNLDRQQTGDAHQETKDTLDLASTVFHG